MIDPTHTDRGRAILYYERGWHGRSRTPIEGVITYFNAQHVFVRFRHGQKEHATLREDLEWPPWWWSTKSAALTVSRIAGRATLIMAALFVVVIIIWSISPISIPVRIVP